MNKRVLIVVTTFVLTGLTRVMAQNDFYLNGLGRAIVTNNKLDGNLLEGDNATNSKGVSGYSLFDLGMNVSVDSNFKANAIMRVRQKFGAFFGGETDFTFRQFQLIGKFRDFEYEIGDINIEMTPYTVHNPDIMFNDYESEIIKMRRDIQEYENFNFGNAWRLQGVKFATDFTFDKGIDYIDWSGFGTRTDVTNDLNVPDRILAGTNVKIAQSKSFEVEGNYVGMQDITVEDFNYNYTNHVFSGSLLYKMDKENFLFTVGGESGISNYDYTETATEDNVSYKDYFYDYGASFELKNTGVKLTASYSEVGPQFSSPSAQTRRININTTPDLFGDLADLVNGGTYNRSQMLFDRSTQEAIYNRNISAVLYAFLPQYGNITPYGKATPNRSGITAKVETTDSIQFVKASAEVKLMNEVIGEGVEDKRSFTGIQGGVALDLGGLLSMDKLFTFTGGARMETTSRSGPVPVDFSSTLIDAGLTYEVYKNLDIMLGTKMISASGTEYLQVRDDFNVLSSFPVHDIDISENFLALGARVRFTNRSNFSANWNQGLSKNNEDETQNYNLNQFFMNYTLIF